MPKGSLDLLAMAMGELTHADQIGALKKGASLTALHHFR
jgi:hypothetical protein